MSDDDSHGQRYVSSQSKKNIADQTSENTHGPQAETENQNSAQTEGGDQSMRYPKRYRRALQYLTDYVSDVECDVQILTNADYCYRVCDVPQTFKEAMSSNESQMWAKAMEEEINSLQENYTFILTTIPESKHVLGVDGSMLSKIIQMRTSHTRPDMLLKAKVMDVDYKETFSPTANITSIRALMQIEEQYDLDLHQIDLKTAYLHAPIDCEIYMEQPEGFEVKSDMGDKLVCKLNKSLYGLKQSGINWNKMLHDYLSENDFVQNSAKHCVYSKQTGKERVTNNLGR